MLALGLLLTAVFARIAAAATVLEGHEHESLSVDATLTLDTVVDIALAAYPDSPVLDARQDQADAWVRRGRSWLGDRPSLMLRYQSDRWGANNGLDEYEAGIEMQMWSWGGRRAVKTYGDALTSESSAAARALRWEVASVVRTALWDVALAENAEELAEQSLARASQLVDAVERRHELGDVALRDVLLARSSYLQQKTAVIEAGAALADAERAYRAFTGLDRRPEFTAENLSSKTAIAEDHPALALADLALARAEANMDVARETANGGPTVTLGTRRERAAFGPEFDDSVGVMVNVPFGGAAHRNTSVASAAREVAEARAARSRQLRQLTLAMHEATHSLTVVKINLSAAEQNLEIAERQLVMGELAYEKGEIELLDLLKIQETAIAAERHVAQLRIDQRRQTSFYNQAVGELP